MVLSDSAGQEMEQSDSCGHKTVLSEKVLPDSDVGQETVLSTVVAKTTVLSDSGGHTAALIRHVTGFIPVY